MAFLWFLVAIIFFVLYVSSNNARTRTNKEQYDKGFADGRQSLISAILKDLKHGALSRKAFEKYSGEAADQVEVNQAIEDSGTAGAVDFPGERGETEEEQPAAAVAVATSPVVVAPVRTKAEQTNRNLNTLLYTASFLIIAAAAAFIATSMPASIRLMGVWFVITAFYVVGLVLHAKVAFLRSAATAFVGTGLALIPFAGIALSQLGGLSAGWSWFITSVIGIICYGIATIRLSSNVVGYLTIAFSLSLAASTVAVVSGPFVLYFIVLIVVSLLFHLSAHYDVKWVPSYFKRPIEQTGHLLTPATLVGSLLAYDTMTAASYQIVFWIAALYYVVLWLTDRKYVYELATRILATVALLVTLFDYVEFNPTASLWLWLAVVGLQFLYSFVRVRTVYASSRTIETVWYWVFITLLMVTTPFWIASDTIREGIIAQVLVIFGASLLLAWRLRSVSVAVPALFASVFLPFLIGRWPTEVIWSIERLTYIFIGMTAVALAVYPSLRGRSLQLRGFLQAAFWLYLLTAFSVSMAQAELTAFALSSIAIAGVTLAASYLYRQWGIEVIPVLLTLPIVSILLIESGMQGEWIATATVGITAALYLLGVSIHQLSGDETRRNLLVASALIVGAGLLGGLFAQTEAVKIVSVALMLLYVVITLAVRFVVKSSFIRSALTISYLVYPIMALLVAYGLGAGWYALIFAVATIIYWVAVYIEKSILFAVFANIATLGLVTSSWVWLKLDSGWLIFGVAWISAAIFYSTYLYYILKAKDTNGWTVQLIFTWIVIGIPTLLFFWSTDQNGYAAATSLVIGGATMAVHGIILSRKEFVEAGIYISTLALQRLVGLSVPDLNITVYGHWWALTLGLVAYWRRTESGLKTRLVLTTAAITASTGIAALSEGGYYQILFLVEHVILLVIGALSRTSWALWWGLVATILAVLYFLRSSLFLSLLFLGLTLLTIVIWRLIRAQQRK